MTTKQESHLARLKQFYDSRLDFKYRKGQREHGGDMFELSAVDLLNEAIDENIDQFVYLVSARDRLIGKETKRK